MAANESPKTLQEAIVYYADLDVCQDALVAARWPNGVECPTCGRNDAVYLKNQRRWQCKDRHPKRQFSAKVGTIFEDSPINLPKWFVAIWLIANAKNGISSYELHRAIGITQKSAWFVLHRIRTAMQVGSIEKLSGTVEADETYVGGSATNMHKDKRERLKLKGGVHNHKTAVLGMIERKGRARARVVSSPQGKVILPVVRETVAEGSTLYTD